MTAAAATYAVRPARGPVALKVAQVLALYGEGVFTFELVWDYDRKRYHVLFILGSAHPTHVRTPISDLVYNGCFGGNPGGRCISHLGYQPTPYCRAIAGHANVALEELPAALLAQPRKVWNAAEIEAALNKQNIGISNQIAPAPHNVTQFQVPGNSTGVATGVDIFNHKHHPAYQLYILLCFRNMQARLLSNYFEKLPYQGHHISALITNKHGQILSWALNTVEYNYTCHAEVNAIFNFTRVYKSQDIPNESIFFSTLKPCAMCAALINRVMQGKKFKVIYAITDKNQLHTELEANRQQIFDIEHLKSIKVFLSRTYKDPVAKAATPAAAAAGAGPQPDYKYAPPPDPFFSLGAAAAGAVTAAAKDPGAGTAAAGTSAVGKGSAAAAAAAAPPKKIDPLVLGGLGIRERLSLATVNQMLFGVFNQSFLNNNSITQYLRSEFGINFILHASVSFTRMIDKYTWAAGNRDKFPRLKLNDDLLKIVTYLLHIGALQGLTTQTPAPATAANAGARAGALPPGQPISDSKSPKK